MSKLKNRTEKKKTKLFRTVFYCFLLHFILKRNGNFINYKLLTKHTNYYDQKKNYKFFNQYYSIFFADDYRYLCYWNFISYLYATNKNIYSLPNRNKLAFYFMGNIQIKSEKNCQTRSKISFLFFLCKFFKKIFTCTPSHTP